MLGYKVIERTLRVQRVIAQIPDVLTNRNGQFHTLKSQNRPFPGRLEIPILIKNIIGRQTGLLRHTHQCLIVEHVGSIEKSFPVFVWIALRSPDHDADTPGRLSDIDECLFAGIDEFRKLKQVTGRIATDCQLGEQDQFRAGGPSFLHGRQDLGGISGNVADPVILLCQCDPHGAKVLTRPRSPRAIVRLYPRYQTMKKTLVFWLLPFVLLACREKVDAPDVAGVEMEVTVERFDQAFFSMDTNRLSEELVRIRKQEPTFYVDFMQQVLGLPANDSSSDVRNNLLFFYEGYRPLYDTLMLAYKPVEDIQQSLRTGLQFVRYYFPRYPSKQKLIFFVGPFDAPGTALTREGMAVGLQQYAGKDFSFYQSPEGTALFPTYISRRFERSYIVVNCMKVLVQELCADPAETGTT